MKARIYIRELFINDGTRIHFEHDDIIVIVGANNSGKSTLLREIMNLGSDLRWLPNSKILKGLAFETIGSVDDLLQTVTDASYRNSNPHGDVTYYGYQWNINVPTAKEDWTMVKSQGLANLKGLFLKYVSSDGRLGLAAQVANFDTLDESPSHPIHFLYSDGETELKFSEAFRKAFNKDLIVNHGSGKFIHLHVGERPKMGQGEDRVSTSYRLKLKQLPTIQEQGDGMRSFVGLLLEVYLGTHSITLIDEPEVFLHPPHARLIGRMLVNDVPADKQIFISTHSEDFLKGLLDTNSSRVKVIRLNRDGDINYSRELTKDQIKQTWSDPLLRHSNVLSGLFHSKVVLCEGDMDCRFYSVILDGLIEIDQAKAKHDQEFKSIPDALFIHCGGKHRMPMVVRSLMKLAVPIVVISDFDLLNNEEPLKSIYEALGGDWTRVRSDWTTVKAEVDSKKPELETVDVKDKITKLLQTENGRIFSSDTADEIKDVLRKTSAWSTAKSVGKSFIPSGNATQAYGRMIAEFTKKGLFIVEVGEVENFDKSIGGHGPKWVNEVLSKDTKAVPELSSARNFIKSVFGNHG